MTDTGPLFVSSGDLIADRRFKWALDQAARGDLAAAADILVQTVERTPAFATAWFALGAIRDRLGEHGHAVTAFEKARDADADDYHGARLQLARLGAGGDPTPAMSESYVRRLFDQYAARYDATLTGHLAYRGPELLFEAVAAVRREAHQSLRFAAMLDLGCGTGLAGGAFRPFTDRLTGVDLAPAMLAQAAAKRIYDRLVEGDIAGFLARETTQAGSYDLVVAADVFVYVNDAAAIIRAIVSVLRPAGVFAFTVETHAGAGIKLLPTLRYAYGEAYVKSALASAKLDAARLERCAVRTEKGEPVEGLLVVATSPAGGIHISQQQRHGTETS